MRCFFVSRHYYCALILCLTGSMEALVFDWLCAGIKLDLPVRWDLRLYSRDPRIANCQVSRAAVFSSLPAALYEKAMLCEKLTLRNEPITVVCVQVRKVLFEHEPRYEDELRLVKDDFVYVSDEEMRESQDSWCSGVSWLTGCSGALPLTYTEPVPETEAWTMHRSVSSVLDHAQVGQSISARPCSGQSVQC